ncbi:mannose-1-phosphate guanylyltransferase/mannose-6-phosphate isomerase [Desulfovibrio mangrovi]|uniref:mannose-1-phosphate guanylyltransferase/mannose-6-phosphate isomerase n=1 Tax=Desulfovibrio mangrovi TaxID=2976983 RepID=UPI0022483843|nr:mannose-1-phosphate guanylyltransferase/mannose-6-phosphate isomerase [Desulfovibrio mangrovi]UZP67529.1 mannose-1-phosphate guanylyltransferase/mannose-6-phosphate isomerase [Desulfovibrio mangrovi]
MLIPVILSGGSGTRLWPLSRKLFPKQLMPMLGGKTSLLQATAGRTVAKAGISSPILVVNEEHRFMVASQMQEIGVHPSGIILEPVARNTAPAVAVAALTAMQQEDDPILLVLPADHYIKDNEAFLAAVDIGVASAQQGSLVTFGIVPDKPETGYGYIKRSAGGAGEGAAPIERFVEKPDRPTAEEYLASGDYLWNSGMFMFKASVFLAELERFNLSMLQACQAATSGARLDLDFVRLDKTAFSGCPSDSIDYAVLEKTDKAVVIPLSCGWSDVGSWSALQEVREKDANNNVCIGDVVAEDTKGCYLHSTNRLIATLGLENVALVETKDAVLAAPLDRVQDVKNIVATLSRDNREEVISHCRVFRPWGNYEGIDLGERYQVKRITVYPGQILSLQKHFHRAEHWVVVKGTALVTRGDEQILLSEDQSTYISLGTVHRLENPGKVNLELIEVQTGSYLGEDDIVRLDDVYGRSGDAAVKGEE